MIARIITIRYYGHGRYDNRYDDDDYYRRRTPRYQPRYNGGYYGGSYYPNSGYSGGSSYPQTGNFPWWDVLIPRY